MRKLTKEHILIARAFIYPEDRTTLAPKNCRYDFIKGGWIKRENNREVFLVKSKDPNKPMVGTKKADIETGEDQKSE